MGISDQPTMLFDLSKLIQPFSDLEFLTQPFSHNEIDLVEKICLR
jgi:hypothetical protein